MKPIEIDYNLPESVTAPVQEALNEGKALFDAGEPYPKGAAPLVCQGWIHASHGTTPCIPTILATA